MTTTKDILKIHLPKPTYKIINEIAKRWSPRYFSNKEISKKDIKTIFEAVRWTPSGHNREPWYFYYVQKGTKSYKNLFSTLDNYNQSWAKTAPVLILACAISRDEQGVNPYSIYDLGAAVFSLVIQTQALGYYARQMALFNKEKVRMLFKLKKDLQPYIIIAIGKIGDYKNAPKEIINYELVPRPRKKKIAEEI